MLLVPVPPVLFLTLEYPTIRSSQMHIQFVGMGIGLHSRLKYSIVLGVCQMESLCLPCLEYAVTGSEKMQPKYSSSTPKCYFCLGVSFCSTCPLLAAVISPAKRHCRLSAFSEGVSATQCPPRETASFRGPTELTGSLKQEKSEQKLSCS